jgi:predicted  nucleic acid-binding Zn-ribbon protein
MEAQLRDSVSKKFHSETVAKLQAEIDRLSRELSSTREELERTRSIGQAIGSLEEQVRNHRSEIEALSGRLEKGTVSNDFYAAAQTRIGELESRIAQLSSTTVPRERYEELQAAVSTMVPREALERAEARIRDLESTLSNSVPKQTLEELKAEITELVSEALTNVAKEAVAAAQAADSRRVDAIAPSAIAPVEVIDRDSTPETATGRQAVQSEPLREKAPTIQTESGA